ncbi:MAG: antibiotic biosynthesis monooxygenase [Ignavibacteriae bacterium]|nr:antibiotic biosynthesis monooxygenase [Ignavibacteriota bacterium]
MRMVHANIRKGAIENLRTYYEQKVIPALGAVQGCLYAGLMNNARSSNRCISLTFWQSREDAEAYERSGVFRTLLDGIRPFLSDESDSTIRLSENLTLEIVPVADEPEVAAYAVQARDQEKTDPGESFWARIVTLRVRTDAFEEFKTLYQDKVIPEIKKAKGCRQMFLSQSVEQPEVVASVTVWNSKQDADAYEREGTFLRLLDITKHTFTDLYRWKLEKEREGDARVATSEDMVVESFDVLVGRSFE